MSDRVLWIQAGRTILMLLVVFVHANLLTQNTIRDWWPYGVPSTIGYGLAVPGFFLLAGYVLALAFPSAQQPIPVRTFARRKVFSTVLPFFVWNGVMVVLEQGIDIDVSAGHPAFLLFAGYWHLYFVFALLQCFAIYVWLHPWMNDERLGWVTLGAVATTAAFYGLSSALLWSDTATTSFYEQRLNRLFVAWIAYFFVGVWLARRPRVFERLSRPVWVLALVALAVALYFLYELELLREDQTFWGTPRKQFLVTGFPQQLAGVLAFVAALRMFERTRLGARVMRALASVAEDTFGIYLCHNAVLMLLYKAAQDADVFDEHRAMLPLLALTAAIVSFVFVRLVRRSGIAGRVLFGASRSARVQTPREGQVPGSPQ